MIARPVPQPKLMTESEAARCLGMTRRQLCEHRYRRAIAFYVVGQKPRYSPEQVEAFARRQAGRDG